MASLWADDSSEVYNQRLNNESSESEDMFMLSSKESSIEKHQISKFGINPAEIQVDNHNSSETSAELRLITANERVELKLKSGNFNVNDNIILASDDSTKVSSNDSMPNKFRPISNGSSIDELYSHFNSTLQGPERAIGLNDPKDNDVYKSAIGKSDSSILLSDKSNCSIIELSDEATTPCIVGRPYQSPLVTTSKNHVIRQWLSNVTLDNTFKTPVSTSKMVIKNVSARKMEEVNGLQDNFKALGGSDVNMVPTDSEYAGISKIHKSVLSTNKSLKGTSNSGFCTPIAKVHSVKHNSVRRKVPDSSSTKKNDTKKLIDVEKLNFDISKLLISNKGSVNIRTHSTKNSVRNTRANSMNLKSTKLHEHYSSCSEESVANDSRRSYSSDEDFHKFVRSKSNKLCKNQISSDDSEEKESSVEFEPQKSVSNQRDLFTPRRKLYCRALSINSLDDEESFKSPVPQCGSKIIVNSIKKGGDRRKLSDLLSIDGDFRVNDRNLDASSIKKERKECALISENLIARGITHLTESVGNVSLKIQKTEVCNATDDALQDKRENDEEYEIVHCDGRTATQDSFPVSLYSDTRQNTSLENSLTNLNEGKTNKFPGSEVSYFRVSDIFNNDSFETNSRPMNNKQNEYLVQLCEIDQTSNANGTPEMIVKDSDDDESFNNKIRSNRKKINILDDSMNNDDDVPEHLSFEKISEKIICNEDCLNTSIDHDDSAAWSNLQNYLRKDIPLPSPKSYVSPKVEGDSFNSIVRSTKKKKKIYTLEDSIDNPHRKHSDSFDLEKYSSFENNSNHSINRYDSSSGFSEVIQTRISFECGSSVCTNESSKSSATDQHDKSPWENFENSSTSRKTYASPTRKNKGHKKQTFINFTLPSYSSCPEHTSFLLSLNEEVPDTMCHPEAVKYRQSYHKHKNVLITLLFRLYNQEIFDDKLPPIDIKWSGQLTTTSGNTRSTSRITERGKVRTSMIKLSKTIVDTPSKARDVLLHELCHAANWLIDEQAGGHGPLFKKWAYKAGRRFPEIPKVKSYHHYELQWKYLYKCTYCGYETGKMKLSLKEDKCRLCGARVTVN